MSFAFAIAELSPASAHRPFNRCTTPTFCSVAASNRFDVAVGAMFDEGAGRRFRMIVESLPAGGGAAAELVVERAMYSDALRVVWAAGTNARATTLQ